MFRQVLFTQWRWGAGIVVLLGSIMVALPLWALYDPPQAPAELLVRVDGFGYLMPGLAALTGLLIALSTWAADHRGGHVYALTLPVPRWYYTLLRFGGGVVLVLAVTLAVWIGGLVATSGLALPTGLRAHAGTVAVRFALASLFTYAAVFAISAGTNRTAGWILAALAALMLAEMVVGSISPGNDPVLLEVVAQVFLKLGLPYELFVGSWPLVAV